jgi:hypothetical protein
MAACAGAPLSGARAQAQTPAPSASPPPPTSPAAAPSASAPASSAPTPSAPAPAPAPDPDPADKPETLPPIPPQPASPAAAGDAAEEKEARTPGWFRVDSDFAGLTLWVGATHDLGGVGLATDVSLSSGPYSAIASGAVVPFSLAEFDVGPAFAFVNGAVALTPMAGIQFDWSQRRTVALVMPQVFTIVNLGPLYFESWVQLYFYGVFTDGAKIRDSLYTRDFLLYKLSDAVALGPNVEVTYLFDNQQVFSLPVGGAAMLNYGKHSTLLVALGYETDEQARASSGGSGDRAIAGRFTFIQTW